METTTQKYTVQRNIMRMAHAFAKKSDAVVKYSKRLGLGIKDAWIRLNATIKVAVAFVWTALGESAIEKMEAAKNAIQDGGKWNGIVYGKPAINKNQGEISVYVSGSIYTFRCWKEDFQQAKKEVQEFLQGTKQGTKQEAYYGYYGCNTKGFDGIED